MCIRDSDYTVNDEPFDDDIAYFHAQWRRQRLTEKGRDYVVLDGVKGEGHYVGTYLALTTLCLLYTSRCV